MKWIERIFEYMRDKRLAEKCGLEVKDICVHEREPDSAPIPYDWDKRFGIDWRFKCKKCGEFYR